MMFTCLSDLDLYFIGYLSILIFGDENSFAGTFYDRLSIYGV